MGVWATKSSDNVLIIQVHFVKYGSDFIFANVCALCNLNGKQDLWLCFGVVFNNNKEAIWCVCSDFNVIRSSDEHMSWVIGPRHDDFSHFNQLIENNILLYLPHYGRRFTWYWGDGFHMSRMGIFLEFEDWCSQWPSNIQRGLMCDLLIVGFRQVYQFVYQVIMW